MADHLLNSVVSIAMAMVGLAVLSVLLSRNANTTQVIGAGSNAFNSGLGMAMSPITGALAGGSSGIGFGGNAVLNFNGVG